MKTRFNTVVKVAILVLVIMFFYALGYNVGHLDADYDYSDSTLTVDELTVKTSDSIIILKGFKSVADGRCTQELLELLAKMEGK